MSLFFEPRLAKLFIVEGREDVVPFVIRVKGVKASNASSLYLVAIDSSWSMDGSKIFFAKEAVLQMLKHLDPGDLVNIYSFCGKVSRVVSAIKVGDAEKIVRTVADIKLGGGTDIYGVLEYMYSDCIALSQTINRGNDVQQTPRDVKVVLVTDGNPTSGVRDEGRILNMAEKLGKCVSVSLVIGVGSDYNERLLAGIAGKTKGFFEHLDDPAKMPLLVKKMVSRYRKLSAKSVKLFIRTAPGIGVYIYNRPAYSVKGGTEIEVGDIYEGEVVDVVGEFVVPPQKKGLTYLAFISASHADGGGKPNEIEVASLVIPCISKVSPEDIEVDEKVFKEINMVRTALALVKDIYGNISADKLNKLIEEITNTTIAIDRRDLYTRTIDLKTQLEREGLSPEVLKKIVSLISRILSGRYDVE